MSLQQTMKTYMTQAMKAKDELRLSVLRNIISAGTNELVSQKKKPTEELSDDDMLGVIKRLARQRKESITQFESGGRPELAEKEQKELDILESFLPATMSREEIEKIAQAKKEELGITDTSGMGRLIGALMKDLNGKADGADVKAAVESLL